MKNEDKIKADFVKMCGLLEITSSGLFFPDEMIEIDSEFSEISESSHYEMLRKKMDNLVNLINSDSSLINKDIEKELWHLI
jgi:hypothetical protein